MWYPSGRTWTPVVIAMFIADDGHVKACVKIPSCATLTYSRGSLLPYAAMAGGDRCPAASWANRVTIGAHL